MGFLKTLSLGLFIARWLRIGRINSTNHGSMPLKPLKGVVSFIVKISSLVWLFLKDAVIYLETFSIEHYHTGESAMDARSCFGLKRRLLIEKHPTIRGNLRDPQNLINP